MIDDEFIQFRVNRSKESLEEAKLMFSNKHYLTVINRLYYAMFYLVAAYLGCNNIFAKTHSGAKSQFQLYFIKTNIVSKDFAELYNDLFQERNDSDYGDFQVISKEDAKDLLDETQKILEEYWEKFEEYRKNKI